ncbi:hypothetical protein HRbin39_01896 [bacterium HR39]|nr:hypothetical protein HRbin39_01896 [bacterium HR39]
MRHLPTVLPAGGDGARDRPPGAAPAHHADIIPRLALLQGGRRDVLPHLLHLLPAQPGHALVVGGIVGDLRALVLLEAADAVLETGGSGHHPRAHQAFVAHVGAEVAVFGAEAHGPVGLGVEVGDLPRLGGVGDEGVGQQHHRHHVVDGDPHRLARHGEGVARAARRQHHDRRIAVAAPQRRQQIRLLRLGGHAGGGAGPLHVDHHERQLGHHREADGLLLEVEAGAGGAGHTDGARIGRADGGADRGDLVLGLEGGHPEPAQAGELVEDGRGRGDGIGGIEQLQPGAAGAVDQPEGDGLVAGDGAIEARLVGGPRHPEARKLRQFRRLGQGVAGAQRGEIGLQHVRPVAEAPARPLLDGREVAVEHPEDQPEGEEVLGAQPLAHAEPGLGRGLLRELGDVDPDHPVGIERAVGARVALEAGLAQMALGEAAGIQDDDGAGLEKRQVHFQRRRIEGHQHVGPVTHGADAAAAEVDLVGGDAVGGARRRADLGGIVGISLETVARERGGEGEEVAGELDAVAGIAGEAHHRRLEFQHLPLRGRLGPLPFVLHDGHARLRPARRRPDARSAAWFSFS